MTDGSADPSSSLSSCARSEAQRIREIGELSAKLCDYSYKATMLGSLSSEVGTRAALMNFSAVFGKAAKAVSWLLQRSEEARKAYETLLNGYQELSAAVTTSDLDHASVVLVARANAQDSEIVEAVKASAEEARETIRNLAAWACASCGARFAASVPAGSLDGVTRCSQCVYSEVASAALAAARQEVKRLRAALTELKNAADDSLRTTGQRAGVPMFVPSVAKRVLAIVGPPLAASGSQGEVDCLAHLVPLPEAAARLRATPQEQE